MSLNLAKTALQIDGMAVDLKARQSDHEARIGNAIAALRAFDQAAYEEKVTLQREETGRLAPRFPDAPDARQATPRYLKDGDFRVAAVDGSHIDVDRHLAARCYLINMGVSVLTYGTDSDAHLYNEPRLYARDSELSIWDEGGANSEAIEGTVLGAKRTVDELSTLVSVVRDTPAERPVLALVDGPLTIVGLARRVFQEFVLRELITDGFAAALEEMQHIAEDRRLALAGYISLPRSAEVVNGLRLQVCPYLAEDRSYRCHSIGPGPQPCDGCVGGALDREIFGRLLAPGERSALFETSSQTLEQFYRGQRIGFFYLNTGEEIARVEVPAWVAENGEMLDFAHEAIIDQCRKGPGYPTALTEAHEQAVVTGADRRYFVQLVEEALHDRGMSVYFSEKSWAKKVRQI